MQDKNTDFDLLVRSTLADAEIRPRKRVWRAVSSRLDSLANAENSSAPVMVPWMRWALVACTCVAVFAIASLSFLRRPHTTDSPILASVESPSKTLSDSPLEVSVPSTTDAPSGLVKSTPKLTTILAERIPSDKADVAEEVNPEPLTEDPTKAEAVTSESDRAPATRTPQAVKPSESRGEVVGTDPFATLESETTSRRHHAKPSLYARGSIASNDARLAKGGMAMMAPGQGSGGFSELSTSSFGVPFTVGVGVRFYLKPRFSIGTGLDYSLLTRTFAGQYTYPRVSGEAERSESGSVSHTMQYIGIPLDFYYDIISASKLKFYVYGGGTIEYCVSNKYTLHSSPDIIRHEVVRKPQVSLGVGLGVEFKLSPLVGLYIDPSVRHYFPCDQPRSIRTEKPVMVNLNAGLRFNF